MKKFMMISAAGLLLLTVGCAGRGQQCPCPQMMAPPPPPPCGCNHHDKGMHNGQTARDGSQQPCARGPKSGMDASGPNEQMRGKKGTHGKPGPGMTPEAKEACQDKKDGDSCTFSQRGWDLTGVCTTHERKPGPDGRKHDGKKGESKKGAPSTKTENIENGPAPLSCSPQDAPDNQPKQAKEKRK